MIGAATNNKRGNGMTDVLGYRAKIGLMVPFTNTSVQPEYEAITPPGVTNHTARLPNRPRPTHSDDAYATVLEEGAVGTEEVIDRLTPAEPAAIILGHSIDSFRGGMDGATALQARLSKHAAICPVYVPSLALKQAVEVLAAPGCRVSVITPYLKPGGDQACGFMDDAGFKVMKRKDFCCQSALAIAAVTEDESRDAIREVDGDDVDAIVQCGTNMAFQRVAAEAEFFLRKPVLSINTATYWAVLRALGIDDRIRGYGTLLEKH
jgi:maleate isomerase